MSARPQRRTPPYRVNAGHQAADRRARRLRPRKLLIRPKLAREVERRRSPEQTVNRLPADFPEDEGMRISHETIYREQYLQGRGALRAELTDALRTSRSAHDETLF